MLADIRAALADGSLIPYTGPGMLGLTGADCPLPASPLALVERLIASTSVPHKLRTNLTGAAQFIENFKHRKTLVSLMQTAFAASVAPSPLHRFLAAQPALPLLVHAWYDSVPQRALAYRDDWGMVQAVSQSEHFGRWTHQFAADGSRVEEAASNWHTVLYQPLGSIAPAANFLVSDSDFVEVLTEIDIQTPIPDVVQNIRAGRHFLFLGCRFATQLERNFAYQIMKRSSAMHWAVLPEAPTRNEARFLERNGIRRIEMKLDAFAGELMQGARAVAA